MLALLADIHVHHTQIRLYRSIDRLYRSPGCKPTSGLCGATSFSSSRGCRCGESSPAGPDKRASLAAASGAHFLCLPCPLYAPLEPAHPVCDQKPVAWQTRATYTARQGAAHASLEPSAHTQHDGAPAIRSKQNRAMQTDNRHKPSNESSGAGIGLLYHRNRQQARRGHTVRRVAARCIVSGSRIAAAACPP